MNVARTWVDGTAPGTVLSYTAFLREGWTNHLPIPMNVITHWLRQDGITARP